MLHICGNCKHSKTNIQDSPCGECIIGGERTRWQACDKADTHYRELERTSIEPITLMEEINRRDQIPPEARLNIALAQKHIMRAGCKAGEDWAKEIGKAKNYLHRALSGKWEA